MDDVVLLTLLSDVAEYKDVGILYLSAQSTLYNLLYLNYHTFPALNAFSK